MTAPVSAYLIDYSKEGNGFDAHCKALEYVARGVEYACPSMKGHMAPALVVANVGQGWVKLPNLFKDGIACGEGMQEGYKRVILDSLQVVNTGTDLVSSLHDLAIIDLGSALAPVGVVFNATSLIIDTAGIVDEVSSVQDYKAGIEKEAISSERKYLNEKINLAYLNITRKAASIAWAVLSLICLLFAALTVGLSIIPYLILGVSIVFLSMNIATYFYGRTIEDQHKAALQGKVPA